MIDLTLPCGTVLHGEKNEYRIDKVLGQGSFGITYLGTLHTTIHGPLGSIDTDIRVAIKEFFLRDVNGRSTTMVTSGGNSDKYDYYKRNFKRESLNLSRLTGIRHHPHIINVYDCFEANNTVYYVMEYISGGSLNDYLRVHGPQSESECLRMGLEIGSALSYMHSHKMLHLDLKPGNIMLRPDGQTVLIDFGLSKQFTDDGHPETSTTIGLGTPGYAPLEQSNYHEGSHVVFPSTMDIYAMGGTLFKILTGQCPPPADEIFNNGFPSDALLDRHVSDRLIRCIEKSMSPKKSERFQSIDLFLHELSLCTPPQPLTSSTDVSSEDTEYLSVDRSSGFKIHTVTTHAETIEANSEGQVSSSKQLKDGKAQDTFYAKYSRKLWTTLGCLISVILVVSLWPSPADTLSSSAEPPSPYAESFSSPEEPPSSSEESPSSSAELPSSSEVSLQEFAILDGHSYVDLGLSVKWATCNVGANSPEEYGDYFAWGETATKSSYTKENSKTYGVKLGDISGNIKYDAARSNWGRGWRLPTRVEFKELVDNCTSTWTTYKGVKGRLVKSRKNGNCIFLPAAGARYGWSHDNVGNIGCYWGATPNEKTKNYYYACFLRFTSDQFSWSDWCSRSSGHSVRCVHD